MKAYHSGHYSANDVEGPTFSEYTEQIMTEKEMHYILSKVVRSLNYAQLIRVAVGITTLLGTFLFFQIHLNGVSIGIRVVVPIVFTILAILAYNFTFKRHIEDLKRRYREISLLLDNLSSSINDNYHRLSGDSAFKAPSSAGSLPESEPDRPFAYFA